MVHAPHLLAARKHRHFRQHAGGLAAPLVCWLVACDDSDPGGAPDRPQTEAADRSWAYVEATGASRFPQCSVRRLADAGGDQRRHPVLGRRSSRPRALHSCLTSSRKRKTSSRGRGPGVMVGWCLELPCGAARPGERLDLEGMRPLTGSRLVDYLAVGGRRRNCLYRSCREKDSTDVKLK